MYRRFDLNLLITFHALWRERNVTRAAKRLNITQPAVSNALSRLREVFGDELFIRTPSGVEPTERCVEIAGELRLALHHIERALAPLDRFIPEESERSFRIGAMDYFDQVVLAPLMKRLENIAPKIDIRVVPLSGGAGFDPLDSGDLDFMFFDGGEPPKRISFERMFEEHFVLIMSDKHPLAGGEVTIKDYADLKHIVFSTRGDGASSVDERLIKQGVSRRVVLTSSQHTSIAVTVAATDMVAMSPSRLAQIFVERGGIVACEAPVFVEGFNFDLFWSRRLNSDPGAMWLREVIREVCAKIPSYKP